MIARKSSSCLTRSQSESSVLQPQTELWYEIDWIEPAETTLQAPNAAEYLWLVVFMGYILLLAAQPQPHPSLTQPNFFCFLSPSPALLFFSFQTNPATRVLCCSTVANMIPDCPRS